MGLNKNEELEKTANGIAAAVKDFDGDQHTRARLLNQVDKLRYLLEEPLDVLNRQWEMVSCRAPVSGKLSKNTAWSRPLG
jgi:hypothetical protein